MKKTIIVRCPKCGQKSLTARDRNDPPGAEILSCLCPSCSDDWPNDLEPEYYDCRGERIVRKSNDF